MHSEEEVKEFLDGCKEHLCYQNSAGLNIDSQRQLVAIAQELLERVNSSADDFVIKHKPSKTIEVTGIITFEGNLTKRHRIDFD
jgi:hypothetical protein